MPTELKLFHSNSTPAREAAYYVTVASFRKVKSKMRSLALLSQR